MLYLLFQKKFNIVEELKEEELLVNFVKESYKDSIKDKNGLKHVKTVLKTLANHYAEQGVSTATISKCLKKHDKPTKKTVTSLLKELKVL